MPKAFRDLSLTFFQASQEDGVAVLKLNLVPPDRLWAEVREYASRIARGPARAIGFSKIALTEGVGAPLWTAFAWERELQNQLFEHPDCKEGVRAFFEKRPPGFGGA